MEICNLVKANSSITIAQMASHLQVSISTLKRDVSILQKLGFILREGNTKNATWVIADKYQASNSSTKTR